MMSCTQGIIYYLLLVALLTLCYLTRIFLKFKLKTTGADEKIQILNTLYLTQKRNVVLVVVAVGVFPNKGTEQ